MLIIGRGGADDDYGSRRWIYLGVFDLQASEVAKLAVLVALARVLGDKGPGPAQLPTAGRLAGHGRWCPSVLVFAEPDLGTSLSFLTIWLTMVLVAGIRWRHALLLAAFGLAATPLVWLSMRDYMRERLVTFMGTLVDLEHAAFDEGYNILQARISIGSGGLFGRGYLEGTQSQLGFLRITQSDFIFSAAAEELGFIGAAVLFCLFVVLLFRVTRAADLSRDDFGRLLAFGVGRDDPVRGGGESRRQPDAAAGHGHSVAVHQLRSHFAADQSGCAGHRAERAVVPTEISVLRS